MYIDEKKSSSVAKFLNQFNLTLIDTCSLMDEGFLKFADDLVSAKGYLKKNNKRIVLKSCVKELKKHSKDQKNDGKRIDALRALKVLKEIKRSGLIKIKNARGNKNFADNAIFTYVSTHRISSSILVITQDKYLCQDLKNLNQSLSQGGRPLLVYRISSSGNLEENYGRPDLVAVGKVRKADIPVRSPVKIPRKIVKVKNDIKLETKTVKSKKKVHSKEIEELLQFDKKLSADIPNPLIKRFEKIEEIHDQLSRLEKVGDEGLKGVKLLNSAEKLNKTLKALNDVPAAKAVKSSKKTTKPKTSKATSKSISVEELKARELRVMANMSNPTYPNANKIKDLKQFKKDLGSLPKEEQSKFKLSSTQIDKKLKELK